MLSEVCGGLSWSGWWAGPHAERIEDRSKFVGRTAGGGGGFPYRKAELFPYNNEWNAADVMRDRAALLETTLGQTVYVRPRSVGTAFFSGWITEPES